MRDASNLSERPPAEWAAIADLFGPCPQWPKTLSDAEWFEFVQAERAVFPTLSARLSLIMRARGWKFDQGQFHLGIIGFTKTGKALSGHRVRLQFNPEKFGSTDIIDRETGEIGGAHWRELWGRPWRIKSRRNRLNTLYPCLSSASKAFLDDASHTTPAAPGFDDSPPKPSHWLPQQQG